MSPFDEEAANVSLQIVAKAMGLRTDTERKRMNNLEAMVAKMSRQYLKRLMRALAVKGPISGTDEELQVFAPDSYVLSALYSQVFKDWVMNDFLGFVDMEKDLKLVGKIVDEEFVKYQADAVRAVQG
jgi:hypothetical protein